MEPSYKEFEQSEGDVIGGVGNGKTTDKQTKVGAYQDNLKTTENIQLSNDVFLFFLWNLVVEYITMTQLLNEKTKG